MHGHMFAGMWVCRCVGVDAHLWACGYVHMHAHVHRCVWVCTCTYGHVGISTRVCPWCKAPGSWKQDPVWPEAGLLGGVLWGCSSGWLYFDLIGSAIRHETQPGSRRQEVPMERSTLSRPHRHLCACQAAVWQLGGLTAPAMGLCASKGRSRAESPSSCVCSTSHMAGDPDL